MVEFPKKGNIIPVICDITACKLQQCIYANDRTSHCVWRLTTHETNCVLNLNSPPLQWLNVADAGIKNCNHARLSTTSDGRVIMTSTDADGRPCLLIYGTNYESGKAVLVQAVPLPSEMSEPLHAVETQSGSFLISHGWRDNPPHGLHRVCEVSLVITSLTSVSMSNDIISSVPFYLCKERVSIPQQLDEVHYPHRFWRLENQYL